MWKFEQDSINAVSIFKDGEKFGDLIVESDEITEEEMEMIQFMIDACNTVAK